MHLVTFSAMVIEIIAYKATHRKRLTKGDQRTRYHRKQPADATDVLSGILHLPAHKYNLRHQRNAMPAHRNGAGKNLIAIQRVSFARQKSAAR